MHPNLSVSTAGVPNPEPLPRLSQELIVLTTLLQGLLVYGLLRGTFGSDPWVRQVLLSTLIAVPGFWVLCLVRLRDRWLSASMALIGLLVLGLNQSVWWALGEPPYRELGHWGVWQLSLLALLFIALAWVQVGMQRRSLRAIPYAWFFGQAWNNAMVLLFAGLFIGLCWLVLGLWAGLFLLLQVSFFAETFQQSAFICMATGVMAGVGVLLARGQPRPMQVVLQLVLSLFRVLLPLLSLVVVLFIAFLPFTGVQPLWDTGHAAPLLMGVMLCLIVFVNAVLQDGGFADAPYPALFRWLIDASLLLMPVLAALTLWAVSLRIGQYGWTLARIWGFSAAVVLALYALTYALAAWRREDSAWLELISRVNPALSWVVMLWLIVLHNPLWHPLRISAASQQARLASGAAPAELTQLVSLRFDHGRHGLAALQALQGQPRFTQDPAKALIDQALAYQHRHDGRQAVQRRDPQRLRTMITAAAGHALPAESWWQAIMAKPGRLRDCEGGGTSCIALQLDMDGDGQSEQLICRIYGNILPTCWIYAQDEQQHWKSVARLEWSDLNSEERSSLQQALREGRVAPVRPRWQDLQVPGAPELARGQVQP